MFLFFVLTIISLLPRAAANKHMYQTGYCFDIGTLLTSLLF